MTAPQQAAPPSRPGAVVGSRWMFSPEWFRTSTGRIAVGLGFLLVVLKAIDAFGWVRTDVIEAGLGITSVSAAFFALLRLRPLARRNHNPIRSPAAVALMGLATFAGGLGAALHALIAIKDPGVPALREYVEPGLLVATLALIVIGTAVLPAGPLPRRQWLPTALDIGTVMMAALIGFWIYGAAPTTSEGTAAGVVALAFIIAIALLSLAQLGAVISLYYRPKPPALQHAFAPFAAGSVFFVMVGSLPSCALLRIDGFSAGVSQLGSSLFALGLAIAAEQTRGANKVAGTAPSPRSHLGVPFASTTLVGLLLATSLISRELWQNQVAVILPALFVALVLIVIRQTITARDNYRLAEEMKNARDAAETANAARLHFLANISHDLRTPLNGVLGCAQILLRDKDLSAKQRELVRTMQGSAEHLRNLINDLLDLSKLEADRLELAPTAFDLPAFLQELIRTFTLEADKKMLLLELRAARDLPSWVEADRKRLQQVLGNLIHNALKFTDRGSVILRASRAGSDLVFEVVDTGCGIMPDQIGELFQPFHVVNERSIKLEGTGLGLSICKKLAQRMGGDITVQSVMSKGSTFTLHIPLTEAVPVVEVQRTIVDYQGRRRRILIVDDQPANRVVLRTMLEPLDFLIDEAGDAATALRRIEFAHPDLILLDLMMPKVDGFALREQIAALDLSPEPPCIAVSALSGDDVETRCTNAGFRQLLHKPVNLELLLEALHTHAGIEWVYGILHPPPHDKMAAVAAERSAAPPAPIVPPAPEQLAEFVDLARRGFIRNLESRASEIAQSEPRLRPFAERVGELARTFKLRELTDWLINLSDQESHGST